MKIELVLLGLLMKGKMHGYDIRKKTVALTKGYITIAFGSIYYAIKKSLKNGWIKKVGTEKVGDNPDRNTYEITPEGKKYYSKSIRKYFDNNLIHFNIDLLLMLIHTLDKRHKRILFEEREVFINEKLSLIREETKAEPETSEKYLINTYIEKHLKAELEWIKSIKL